MLNLRHVALAGGSAFVLLFAVAACGDDGDESVFDAEVGECIQEPDTGVEDIETFEEVDCDEDHFGEIFFLFEHEGDDDDFPGFEDLEAEAAETCEGDEFEDYTDTEYSESAIFVAQVNPSEQSWGGGDRETICILTTGDDVDTSFEGNGEDFLLENGDGGDEPDLDALIEACEGGDMASCDDLWLNTPVGSEEERIGATCGGRSEEELDGGCEAEFG
jgi:hypothetical protein